MTVSLEERDARDGKAEPRERARGLRILAFCDYFSPSMGGGAERVALEVYRRLAAWGAELTVMTTAGPSTTWGQELRVVHARSTDLTRFLGFQSSITTGATRLASRLAAETRAHVLHANSLQFQTSLAAARLQRRSGLPLVLTVHLGGFEALGQPLRTAAVLHERTIGSYVLARSRRVIAVSDAVAQHLCQLGVEDRVRVVPNGVDHERFRPMGHSVSTSSGVHVVFVGRLVKNKGPDVLLEAFARLREARAPARLSIVGDGPMREPLERRTRSLGLGDVVRFAGFSDRVDSLLRDAHVFVRPTLTEGMPLAVLEAMAAGVCVVASDVPGNAGLIHHGTTGVLFRAGDVAGLTEALQRVVVDQVERGRLARAGHGVALDHSWDRCAEETLGVLLEALPGTPAGRTA